LAELKRVSGVDLSMVRPELVLTHYLELAEHGVVPSLVPPDVAGQVRALVKHYETALKDDPDNRATCDPGCGGVSDMRLPACPFCGDSEEQLVENGKLVTRKLAGGSGDAATREDAADEPSGSGVPISPQPPASLRGRDPGVTLAEYHEQLLGEQLHGTPDLDRCVHNINRFAEATARSIWHLGREVIRCHDDQLWKQRVLSDGSPAYASFRAFVIAELKISSAYAYKLIDVCRNCTEQQVRELGPSKLELLIKAPPAIRPQLEAGAAGKSAVEISEELKRLVDEAIGEPVDVPEDVITVALTMRKVILPLQARPKGHEHPPLSVATKPARGLEDEPWAEERLANGVRQRYRLVRNARGELELHVERRRSSPQGDALRDEEAFPPAPVVSIPLEGQP
jgi:hypothetical protein